MKSFEFKGAWKTQLKLPSFAQLRDSEFYDINSNQDWIKEKAEALENNLVDVKFNDAPNNNELPELIQINAVNFILNNEHEILDEIFNVMKNIIYPYFNKIAGWNFQEEYPLNSKDDLKYCLGINEIMIDFIGSDKIAWTTYIFESILDSEHGLSILFEGKRFIKHDSAYDMNYKSLLTEIAYDNYIADINKHHISSGSKQHYPIKDKEFYKPWELEQTKYYLLNLIDENKIEKFKAILSKSEFNINLPFPELGHTLIEEVIRKGELDLAEWMYKHGALIDNILHQGNQFYENYNRIEFINKIDGDINKTDKNGKTLGNKYLDVASREFSYNNPKRIELYKSHLELLIRYGAKLNIEEYHIEAIEQMKLFE